jgi:hypothetical protein
MGYPHIESLWTLHAIIIEVEGIVLNIFLFVELCRTHIRK